MARWLPFFLKHWKKLLLVLLAAVGIFAFRLLDLGSYLNFEYFIRRRSAILQYVGANYWQSVAAYLGLYMSTAFFVPGALVLSVTGGFLFGVLPAVLYINAAATLGSFLALLLSRYLIGEWIQARYADRLKPLNSSLERYGVSYLLAVRIIPVLPFFVVNYLAGLTRIPLKTFVWTTSLGTLPGSFVYAYTGRELGSITSEKDILSPRVLAALILLGLFTLFPPVFNYLKQRRKRTRGI
jgi:uncharacterized membrane protein YdjX (TVP38/TMEM64 family)